MRSYPCKLSKWKKVIPTAKRLLYEKCVDDSNWDFLLDSIVECSDTIVRAQGWYDNKEFSDLTIKELEGWELWYWQGSYYGF